MMMTDGVPTVAELIDSSLAKYITLAANDCRYSGTVEAVGGPPHFSRQEFSCSSGNVPHRIGEKKYKNTTTVDLPIFDQASFRPASPPIFPLPISEYRQPAVQIGDCHCMYFSKVHAVTVANF